MVKSNQNTVLRRPKVPRAEKGSKRGWPAVAGQVPPSLYSDFDEIAVQEQKAYSDLVREAVELLIASRKAA